MTQFKEILEREKNRELNGDFNTIVFIQEGSFYRAYEWSAWLCCRYINTFKVTRRIDKSELTADGTVLFVGFPITSVSKYIPETWDVKAIGEKCLSVSLPSDVFDPPKVESSLVDDFAHWKQSVPITATKKGSLKNDLKAGSIGDGGFHRMSEVLSEILSYPIEQKSPMECMSFVADLKQQIAAML